MQVSPQPFDSRRYAKCIEISLQAQAKSDADYYVGICKRKFMPKESDRIYRAFLAAYRYQYIVSGVQNQRFGEVLGGMISPAHAARIGAALKPILEG
jgi:hypothetical protein